VKNSPGRNFAKGVNQNFPHMLHWAIYMLNKTFPLFLLPPFFTFPLEGKKPKGGT